MTQSPCLPELPKLPRPHATVPADGGPSDRYTADQMNARWHEGYEAGLRARAAQGEATLRDWESTCDDCAGTGKVDHSEPLYVDGRYMDNDLFRIPCNTCLSCGVTVCIADIPKEIQR